MKTNHLFIAALLLLGTVSCGTNYRMTSQIGSDGSIYREVYARGDSAFIAGDKNHNPYMFQNRCRLANSKAGLCHQIRLLGRKKN